jgi:hypothetical protein
LEFEKGQHSWDWYADETGQSSWDWYADEMKGQCSWDSLTLIQHSWSSQRTRPNKKQHFQHELDDCGVVATGELDGIDGLDSTDMIQYLTRKNEGID